MDERKEDYEFHVLPLYYVPEKGDKARYLTFRLRGNEEFLKRTRQSVKDRINALEFITKPPDASYQDFKGLRNELGEEG